MKNSELEAKILDIIDRVKRNQPIEDSTVELKSEWPEPKKAARQLAGHANAARGEPITWVIGVDEKACKVVGASQSDSATWLQQVASEFDAGFVPELVIDIAIPCDSTTVVGLHFETDRAPFLVKNPKFGQPDGGPVQYEVPWRVGTGLKTARRGDLLRLLTPIARLPEVEVLAANLNCGPSKDGNLAWDFKADLFLLPKTSTRLTIPHHRTHFYYQDSYSGERVNFESRGLNPYESGLIRSVPGALLIEGPGTVSAPGHFKTAFRSSGYPGAPLVELELGIAEAENRRLVVNVVLGNRVQRGSRIEWTTIPRS
jgi:hypothetical protein